MAKYSKKALKRRKAVNIAASLVASGVPFNDNTLSDEVRVAAAQKIGTQGRVSTLGQLHRANTLSNTLNERSKVGKISSQLDAAYKQAGKSPFDKGATGRKKRNTGHR